MNFLTDRYWAIHSPVDALLDRIRGEGVVQTPSAAEISNIRAAQNATPPFQMAGGVAVVNLAGPMVKSDGWWVEFFGYASTPKIRRNLQAAIDDKSVSSIIIHIDSPGGSVAGTSDLADAIHAAAKVKTVYAYIADIGASAAYWVASQADKVYSNSTALVGSIGTYLVAVDWSKAAEAEGAKVHVIRAGEFKGAGTAGTEITDSQLAEFQREINSLNELFLAGVSRGRKMSLDSVRALADGRVHVGLEAQALGLIDGVQTLEITIGQAQRAAVLRTTAKSSSEAATNFNGDKLMKFSKAQRLMLTLLTMPAAATDAEALAFYSSLPPDKKLIVMEQPADESAQAASPAPAATPATPAAPAVDATAVSKAERERCSEIHALAGKFGMDAKWTAGHISGNTTVQAVKDEVLAKFEKENAPVLAADGSINVGDNLAIATLGPAMEDAILARSNLKIYQTNEDGSIARGADGRGIVAKPHEASRQFMGRSAVEMARLYLNTLGVKTDGMSRPAIAQLIFNRRKMQRLAGGHLAVHSTSDFDNILANALNKSLRAPFAERPASWRRWAGKMTAPDFKEIKLTAGGGFGVPPAVPEGMEYTYATMGDFKEVFTLGKYGYIFNLTWEAFVNDDLGAFGRTAQKQGAACMRLEDNIAYGILTANAVMSDSVALFHATHANLSGSADAISVASLSAGKAAMRQQNGINAEEELDIMPRFLLCPVGKEDLAKQVVGSTVDVSKNNSANNPVYNEFEVIANPRLDANSSTSWYLTAGPDEFDTVMMAFLEGMETPEFTEESGFDVDSRKFKVKHVVAGKAADWRGLYKNATS